MSVRRNLFQSQLTRRPTATSSSSASSDGLLRPDADQQQAPSGSSAVSTTAATAASTSADIVVRDKNGDVELGDPPTPPLDEPDDAVLDARHENESKDVF